MIELVKNAQNVFIEQGVIYMKTDSKAHPFEILEEVDYSIEDIKSGHHYHHYLYNGKLYDSFLTNDLSWLIEKKQKRPTLFDI